MRETKNIRNRTDSTQDRPIRLHKKSHLSDGIVGRLRYTEQKVRKGGALAKA
jgi:hypothetical protein